MAQSSLLEAPEGTGSADSARSALVGRLLELAGELHRTFKVSVSAEMRARVGGLTLHQLDALMALERSPLAMRALAERLEISESAATALADRLVAHGLVERRVDPNDRRSVRLVLSGEAAELTASFRQRQRAHAEDVVQVLSTAELAELVSLLEQLAGRAPGGAAGDDPEKHGVDSEAERTEADHD
jgi:DNA-binding MarR family transcriptional regulator